MGIPAHGYGYGDSHSVPTAALGFVDGSREWGREESGGKRCTSESSEVASPATGSLGSAERHRKQSDASKSLFYLRKTRDCTQTH